MSRAGAARARTFMADDKPLTPCDAVAAIITADGRYLMQLRDDHGGIFYPDHWGLFGGGIEPGEDETEALIRELDEELGLAIGAEEVRRFSAFRFDFAFAGGASVIRAFYEVSLDPARLKALRVREGRRMDLFEPEEALDPDRKIAPYDAFAVWLHANRTRIDLSAAQRPRKAARPGAV